MPHKPNRVFTFLIGQNVTEKDKQTFKSIACENKGEFIIYINLQNPNPTNNQTSLASKFS